MPILAIVVVIPAINGKAPQIPQPVKPKKKSLQNSLLKSFFFEKSHCKKMEIKLIKTVNHLQKLMKQEGHILHHLEQLLY